MGRCFAILYAAAVLFSQTAHLEWLRKFSEAPFSFGNFVETALAVVALLLIRAQWRNGSGSTKFLVVLAALYLLAFACWLPMVSNHRIVLAVISFAVFTAGMLHLARRGSLPESQDELLRHCRSSLCAFAILVYFFAFLAKLNSDYLIAEYSCATQFFTHVVWYNETLSKNVLLQQTAIWGSIIVEFLLIPGLLWSRTRNAAVLLGLVFHLVLALDLVKHFVDFSSVMYVLLPLFLTGVPPMNRITPLLKWLVALFIVLIVFGTFASSSQSLFMSFVIARELLWLSYALAVVFLVAKVRVDPEVQFEAVSPLPGSRALYLVIVGIALVNGLSPFLGLKTRTSFNMYSNLIITESESNHLLVSRSLDIFGLLADRARIEATQDSKFLANFGSPTADVPYTGLAAYLLAHPYTQVRFNYQGRSYQFPQDPLPRRPNLFLRKFAMFRASREGVPGFCIW